MMTMTKQHFESLAETLGMAVAVESIADEDDLAIVSTGAAYGVRIRDLIAPASWGRLIPR